MVWLLCRNPECERKWDYTGKNKIRALCPDCGRRVPIKTCKTKPPSKRK